MSARCRSPIGGAACAPGAKNCPPASEACKSSSSSTEPIAKNNEFRTHPRKFFGLLLRRASYINHLIRKFGPRKQRIQLPVSTESAHPAGERKQQADCAGAAENAARP